MRWHDDNVIIPNFPQELQRVAMLIILMPENYMNDMIKAYKNGNKRQVVGAGANRMI
jgi:hypothetical protein